MNLKGALSYGLSLTRHPVLTWRVTRGLVKALQNPAPAHADPLLAAAEWLMLAQRQCPDGNGYARRYRLGFGWDLGYVETTGYIIPTLLAVARHTGEVRFRDSALAAGEWLLHRQNPGGSFNEIDRHTPQAFDTGQVLLGLTALCREFPDKVEYRYAAGRAAAWLCEKLNDNGTWTEVAYAGQAHTYYSRSGAALLETGLMQGNHDWTNAAHRHLDWVLSRQQASGWFLDCEFEIGRPALLHTIVYVMEGLLHAYQLSARKEYHDAAKRCALGLMMAAGKEKREIPAAYYGRDWESASTEFCITGLAQWAGVCLRLEKMNPGEGFARQAGNCLSLLRAVQIVEPGPLQGALPNVIPWTGSYGKMGAYNWNLKFYIDALLETETAAH